MRPPELEATLFDDPTDLDAWQVYGDWLQDRDDAHGELISLDLRRARGQGDAAELDARIEAILAEHRATWLGDLAPLLERGVDEDLVNFEWRYGYIVRATVAGGDEEPEAGAATPELLLRALLASPASRFMTALTVGATYDDDPWMGMMDSSLKILAEAGAREALTTLEIRDVLEFWDISSTIVGDVSEVLAVTPRLRRLYVRGNYIDLTELAHARLEQLRIETGGLPAETACAIGLCQLPACAELVVYFGSDYYGGTSSMDDILPLLAGEGTPRLARLGLCNAEFQDEIAAAVATSPLLPRLRSLDLSLGTMTDAGARELLRHAGRFAHLEVLDLRENHLSEAACAELRAGLANVVVDGQKQTSGYTYVSVAE